MPEHESMEQRHRAPDSPRSAISRRHFVRRVGAAGLGVLRPGRLPRRLRRGEGDGQEGTTRTPPATHPKVAIGAMTFSNWPLYIDTSVLKTWDKADRRQGQVHRGHQRQRGVLRQGPPAAPGRAADRPRPRRAHRLDGRPLGAQRLRRADRQGATSPTPRTSRRTSRNPQLRPRAQVHAAVAVGHDRHRLQPEEDRRQARQRSTRSSTRSSRAA